MTNKLLAIGGIAVVVAGLALLIMPAGHIPLLDANRTILAESQIDGYCSGLTFIATQGKGNADDAADCRAAEEERNVRSDQQNLAQVQTSWCYGIVEAGWGGTPTDCIGILQQNKIWPTMDGSITNAWNRRFPYPLSDLGTAQAPKYGDQSRTGDRETNDREGFSR